MSEHVVRRGSYIQFVDEEVLNRKTKIFRVETLMASPVILGTVKWFGSWRCYAFYPGAQTVYEQKCLREIADFCQDQTTAHRLSAKPFPDDFVLSAKEP